MGETTYIHLAATWYQSMFLPVILIYWAWQYSNLLGRNLISDISPCSYQSNFSIDSTLLGNALFYSNRLFLFSIDFYSVIVINSSCCYSYIQCPHFWQWKIWSKFCVDTFDVSWYRLTWNHSAHFNIFWEWLISRSLSLSLMTISCVSIMDILTAFLDQMS